MCEGVETMIFGLNAARSSDVQVGDSCRGSRRDQLARCVRVEPTTRLTEVNRPAIDEALGGDDLMHYRVGHLRVGGHHHRRQAPVLTVAALIWSVPNCR